MSSDLPSDVPFPGPSDADAGAGLAALLATRGAPLVEALGGHHPGAREHSDGTAAYAFAGAVELGFERSRCEVAREAARLHEVGQIYVASELLAKPVSERSAHEAETVDAHFEAGYRLARGAGIPQHVCGWLLRARERYDGGGPERLAADAIPVEVRIMRAACVCHTALAAPGGGDTSPHQRAVERLSAGTGGDLDPRVVAALVAVINRASVTARP